MLLFILRPFCGRLRQGMFSGRHEQHGVPAVSSEKIFSFFQKISHEHPLPFATGFRYYFFVK